MNAPAHTTCFSSPLPVRCRLVFEARSLHMSRAQSTKMACWAYMATICQETI